MKPAGSEACARGREQSDDVARACSGWSLVPQGQGRADVLLVEAREQHTRGRVEITHHADGGLDESGRAGLQIDVDGHAREGVEDIGQGGRVEASAEIRTLCGAGTAGIAEAMAKIPRLQLAEGGGADGVWTTGEACARLVVKHHDVAICGQVDIGLEGISAEVEGALERFECVLGQLHPGSAMREHQRPTVAPVPMKRGERERVRAAESRAGHGAPRW